MRPQSLAKFEMMLRKIARSIACVRGNRAWLLLAIPLSLSAFHEHWGRAQLQAALEAAQAEFQAKTLHQQQLCFERRVRDAERSAELSDEDKIFDFGAIDISQYPRRATAKGRAKKVGTQSRSAS